MTPRRLLLIDLVGACLSALALAFVLPVLDLSGLPRRVLFGLATIAAGLAAHSFARQRRTTSSHGRPLRACALLNVLYCCVSVAVLVLYRDALTIVDLVYFPAEIVIVAALASIEWRAASRA